jgi:predicted HTH transcriptional regulator
MALNIDGFKIIGNAPSRVSKPKAKKKNITVKKQTSERTVSIVFESIKALKKTTREYFVAYTGLSSSTVDKCLLILEANGSVKRERGRKGSQKQTTITLIN